MPALPSQTNNPVAPLWVEGKVSFRFELALFPDTGAGDLWDTGLWDTAIWAGNEPQWVISWEPTPLLVWRSGPPGSGMPMAGLCWITLKANTTLTLVLMIRASWLSGRGDGAG